MRRTTLIALTLLLYVVVIAATALALVAARRAAVESFDNAGQQAHWEHFRAEMDERHDQREALRGEIARGSGQPIAPRPPKSRSLRPPALELLTEHFAACAVVSLLAVSGLFAVIWGMLVGAVLRPGRAIGKVDSLARAENIRPAINRELR